MLGKIIRGIAGFYYVHVPDKGTYECHAKGIFRKEKKKPLAGDNVRIEILDEKEKEGNLVEILSRKNALIRPAAANVDQALVIFAIHQPNPNFGLLDRFLIMMEHYGIPAVICFNKKDIACWEEQEELRRMYEKSGCRVLFISALETNGIEVIPGMLNGKTTVVAGPSGVGKSSLVNLLQGVVTMETGEISRKIQRGKHTTRHSELICIAEDSYIVDTPGFSSMYVQNFEKEQLKEYFPEFREYEPDCRFQGCVHINEPDCRVKRAVMDGGIHSARYESYLGLYREMKDKKSY